MRAAEQSMLRWAESALDFVQDVFAPEEIDTWQREALIDFSKPSCDKMAFQSCKGPGKTCVEAWIAWWFLLTRPNSRVFATSINGKNLRDNLWAEMGSWLSISKEIAQGRSVLSEAFEYGSTRIYSTAPDKQGAWFMSARTWEKSSDPSDQSAGLAGGHAPYTLFILDEVSGIPDGVFAAAEASLSTGVENKLLVAGNPLYLRGPLYNIAKKQAHKWKIIKITADPENPKRSKRVKLEYAQDQIEKWGRNHPFVIVNIFGEFPPVSANALLGPDEIERAMNRNLDPKEYEGAQRRIAVDVAQYGDDANILAKRQGLRIWPLEEQRNLDTYAKAEWVIRNQEQFGSEMQIIDGTGGYGSGLNDALLRLGMNVPGGLNPISVHFSSKSLSRNYYNKRSEMWYELALWVKRGGWLPNDSLLAEELQAMYYIENDQIRMEEKEHMKIRLGRSPDRADACILTFAFPEVPANRSYLPGLPTDILDMMGRVQKQESMDYDPMTNEERVWDRNPFEFN